MALSDVTKKGVERAIVEFDRLGREDFLAQFGFSLLLATFSFKEDSAMTLKLSSGSRMDMIGRSSAPSQVQISPMARSTWSVISSISDSKSRDLPAIPLGLRKS